MATQTSITLTHDKEATVDIKARLQAANGHSRQEANLLIDFIAALASGVRMGSMNVGVDDGDGVAATGTVTFASLANNDTVTVGTQVFTAKTSGASGANQFNLGANDTDAATNFAAAVNAHASLLGVVTASPAAAVTTITSAVKGLIGNQIGIAISAHGSVSGSGKLTSGAAANNSVINTYKFGV